MHFIEINYMSCIPWLLYVMHAMAFICHVFHGKDLSLHVRVYKTNCYMTGENPVS